MSTLSTRHWRGFNLTELLNGDRRLEYREADFHFMAHWGFNFARLPCSYWTWSDRNSWAIIDEAALKPLDRAVQLGRQYGVHINICLHRIPGYSVGSSDSEPHRLFSGTSESMEDALRAAEHHWRYLAGRYRDEPSSQLSFDLLNEPPFMTDQSRYIQIARRLVAAIRGISPDRLLFVDGADIGQTPVIGLGEQSIIQSTRGYLPKMVSHYTAGWVPKNEFESFSVPTWPMVDDNGVLWNRSTLLNEVVPKWRPLLDAGVPVHVGEWGCHNKTPHESCLSWMSDWLSIWKEMNWGWALWNLRGPFGVLDSGRADVSYERFDGRLLDRAMLELLVAA